ncbi:MAG: phosphatase PAP2 family protein [bacterium]
MNNFLDKIRISDYNWYYHIYYLGLNNHALGDTFYFFAKYGVVISFLSFTYLIWVKKINAFICSFLAMAIAGSFDLLITIFWDRPRPFITHHDLAEPITQGLRVDPTSFPSGHTYIAFAIATSIFLYGHRRLGIFLFLVAIGVAVGRIGAGLHYPSDIIAGALLGIISGVVAYLIVQKAEEKWDAK